MLVLFFLQLLGRTVQKESLVERFPVFFYQLDIAHDVQYAAVFVADAVLDADAVAFVFEAAYRFPERAFVFI